MGTGHPWPVLSAERGAQDLATGQANSAGQLLAAMIAMSGGVGLVPEQVWDAPNVAASPFGTDPTLASIGFVNGKPDGSAGPLTWGAGSLVRLTADLSAGRVLEQPAQTVDRYITHTQLATTLTVTSPPDQTAATNPIHVAGTAVPGATIDVADVGTRSTTHASGTAAADGSFSFDIAPLIGNNVLVVTSTAPNGGTAQAVRTVVNDVVQGTLLFDSTDPTGDDNGPGNYAYPTAPDFHAGAFDLTDFQVYDTGSTVTFRVQTRDLSPTFGSPLGAQLVDVYVHQPGASPTSTAASFAHAELHHRIGERLEPVARGTGLRTAVRRFNQHEHGGHHHDQRQPDLPLHHVLGGQDGTRRHTRVGLGVHGRADRPGRLQPGSGAGLPADSAAVPVRRLRDSELRPALHLRPEHCAEGGRRAHPVGREPVRRVGLHVLSPVVMQGVTLP